MSSKFFNKSTCGFFVVMVGILFCHEISAELIEQGNSQVHPTERFDTNRADENIYVANNNSVQQLFYVLGGAINKPIIASSEAAKKRVSGNFDLSRPRELLSTLASRTGLIWYDDGSSIYVYDTSEVQSSVVRLAYAPFDRLVAYLKSSGLYDERFPLRSNGQAGSFYVSGPPVYVELITAAAKYIDATYAQPGTGESVIRVIKLKNAFVNDRTYTQRDAPVIVPGIATVLNQLLNNSYGTGGRHAASARITVDTDTQHALDTASASQRGNFPPLPSLGAASQASSRSSNEPTNENSINIVAYSATNSLLVQGSERQVSFVEDLVSAVDIPKQQIQLSLWIIDVSKDDINQLGVRWQAAAKISNGGVTFNTSSLTPENSFNFLADVSALAQKGNAQVVSRPEILTQENVPALFDNNSSFYAKLVGERTSSLEKITYGTMISVLPRLSPRQQEIEMTLNIQDGGVPIDINGKTGNVDSIPMVNNTQISTEARVPVGYSLLVGGYSRDQDEYHSLGIPVLRDIPFLGGLFDYSYVSHKKMVRLFLIQPRLMVNGETWQGRDDDNSVLGRTLSGSEVTLKSTVSMLRENMNKQ
ncbi:type III secretion system outer membrane ring subunit SctC [Pectobacterium parvum]|uniref:type III secretion system outer membrane ring subunit SctC n=1 Tax=Pectobacterium parvum TaxID=2778550 RepID=UPI000504D71C|nr:type III secretion system outer membrane ring subunit SctC [Pectobacterium parvum]KFX17941.1 type III secretion system protein [Pectobacterium parvum]MCU1800739.1 EscC/YscC/HrcC family type III secretion system outer membrane ring protein [Pectobacterium parvum]